MNSFYIFTILLLSAAAFIGYRVGLIKIIFLFLQIAAAASAVYFLYPLMSGWLNQSFSGQDWTSPAVVILIALMVFISLHYLLNYLVQSKATIHSTLLNRSAGTVTGIAVGCIAVLSIGHFTTVVTVPRYVETAMVDASINDVLDVSGKWIDREWLPVFEKPAIQVMASDNVDVVSHEAVELPYTTNDFESRTDLEFQMLQLINAERKKYGLKLLTDDQALDNVARAHAADMFRRGYFSHNTPEGVDPFQRLRKAKIKYRFAGENLALAQTLLQAHKELMKSPGHRANILNPGYGRIGIGILKAGNHGLMITQEFRD